MLRILIITTKNYDKETKEITKENPKELLDIVSSRSLSKIQVNLLKTIIINPSVTLQILSSELGLTIDQIRYQRKQLEAKGIFSLSQRSNKERHMGDPISRQTISNQFSTLIYMIMDKNLDIQMGGV